MHNLKNLLLSASLAVVLLPAVADDELAPWEKTAPESIADLIAIQDKVQGMLKDAMASTVTLQMGGSSGSGVIISSDGLVLTAGHVSGTPGRKVTVVLADGRKFEGKALGKNSADAGMVQILKPKDLPTSHYETHKTNLPKVGQWVVSVGNPGGLDVKRGAVVRLGRIIFAREKTLRSDCKLLGGDSGGPLFNLDGTVIGIHSRISGEPDQNYHVSMPAFHSDWKNLSEPALPGFLGVTTVDYNQDDLEGAEVESIRDNSPAKKAGLKKGDIITRVGDKDVKAARDLTTLIGKLRPGAKAKLTVMRDGEQTTLEATLGSRPAPGPRLPFGLPPRR